MELVGEKSVFELRAHVPVTSLKFFRLPDSNFLIKLKAKDLRFAKELEYLNTAGVWTEMGLSALLVDEKGSGGHEELGQLMEPRSQSSREYWRYYP